LKAVFALALVSLLAGCSTLASRGAWVGCQAADTATTAYALEHGGRELNPVVGAIIAAFGTAGFIVAKAGVTLAVLGEYSRISSDVVATASGITCAVAAHNAMVSRRLAREAETKP
jgi:hypothetical protein